MTWQLADILLIAVVVAVLVAWGMVKVGRARLHAHGWHALAWRWLSGQPHHGRPVTDAGWFRPGQRALTVTGHATRFWHLPRWKRAAWRGGSTLAVLAALAGYVADPWLTSMFVIFVVVAGVGTASVVLGRRVLARRHQRTWLHPLHLAAHELAGIPRARLAKSWITAELDDAGAVGRAVLELPPGWPADDRDKGRLVSIASAKLGIEAPEASWRQAGPEPRLTLTRSKPPPSIVTLDDIREAVAAARADELVCGIGKQGAIVKASLSNDSPHLGISMGSGGGKSNLAAFWLLQELSRGAIALVLDAKWISHPWLIGLPNVAYARTPAQLHAAMVWLSDELDRRNQVALRSVDVRGTVRANVGPRIFIVAEELNLAIPRIRSYWDEMREKDDSKRSPALIGLGEVAFAGRQVKMHLVLIGQMLTAAATGSKDSSVKENVGIKAMARYSPNAWKNMAPEHPMPPKPTAVGRIQLVTAAGVRETQVPLVDVERARELVLAGEVTPCPAGMPGAIRVSDAVPIGLGTPDQPVVPETPPAVAAPGGAVTLSEAVAMGVVSCSLAAVRKASQRDPEFPRRAGMRRLAGEYDAAGLAAWDARRS